MGSATQLCLNYGLAYRNPNTENRPNFCDITQLLQRSDFHILKWSADDINLYGKEIRTIGCPLQLSKELYQELQNTYVPVIKP